MSHTHRGPRARAQNDPKPRQQADSGRVFRERGVREMGGPQPQTHPHILRQSWWMNKGPGCDSALPRPRPASRQMLWADDVRPVAAWKRFEDDLLPSGNDHSPHTEEQHKSHSYLSDKVGKHQHALCTLLSFLQTHREKERRGLLLPTWWWAKKIGLLFTTSPP